MKKQISKFRLLKYSTVFLTIVLLMPASSDAQIIAGGGSMPTNYNNPDNKGSKDDDSYGVFKVGINLPMGTFSQQIPLFTAPTYPALTLLNNLNAPFKGTAGLGATKGFSFEYSQFISFGEVKLGSKLPGRVGIQLGYDFDYTPINWSAENWSNYHITVLTYPFYFSGFKIGPQFNINPIDNMGLCFYLTIDPYISVPGQEKASYYYNDPNGYTNTLDYSIRDSTLVQGNMNVSLGVNFYYKALFVGIEYNWMHTRYNGSATGSYEFSSSNSSTYGNLGGGWSEVLQCNMLKFTLGVRFGTGRR